MKILLDHNVPHLLRKEFRPEDEVYTAEFLGWEEFGNGDLLKAASRAAFDVLVTTDTDYRHLDADEMIFVLLRAYDNRRETLARLMPEVLTVLDQVQPGEHHEVGPLAGR